MNLLETIRFFKGFNPRMEITQIEAALICFSLNDEDRTPAYFRERLGWYSSTTSRNLALLSDRGYGKTEGLGWIKLEVDSKRRNAKNILLTPKGIEVKHELAKRCA